MLFKAVVISHMKYFRDQNDNSRINLTGMPFLFKDQNDKNKTLGAKRQSNLIWILLIYGFEMIR